MSGLEDKLQKINKEIELASNAIDSLNKKALTGDLGFSDVIKAIDGASNHAVQFTKIIGDLGSKLTLGLDFGAISGSVGFLADTFDSVMGSAKEVALVFNNVGIAIDSITSYSRSLNKSMYESVSRFNGSFEAAKNFSEYIIQSSREFGKAEAGFVSPANRIEAVKSLTDAGLSIDIMTDSIETAAGKMDILNTSFLHSQSLGMSLGQYTKHLGEAMLMQGLDTQEAAEQMALFGNVSEATGIRTDKVANSLQSFANNFSKLGVTAAFGAPVLEGFASSLKDMGLGFENAISLSSSLSSSLMRLTSDYSTAYLTFQRGGLDIGGGQGALGAGIGLRARLSEAESRGEQGDMAMQLTQSLKSTLESFTGGQIVTVQQAAMDPSLQATFYTQTKLLGDLYSIQDPGAQDRTLELLSRLDEATKSGDTELAASLAEDIQNIKDARSETLGYEEKTAIATQATYAELQLLNKNIMGALKYEGDTLANAAQEMQSRAFETAKIPIMQMNENIDPEQIAIQQEAAIASFKERSKESFEDLSEIIKAVFSETKETFGNVAVNLSDDAKELIMRSSAAVEQLSTRLDEYIQKREKSGLR